MKYFEFVESIKEGMSSNDNIKKRASRLSDELIEFTLDYIMRTREFIAMENEQFKNNIDILIDNTDFANKVRDRYRISLTPERLSKVLEAMCLDCPCLEMVEEKNEIADLLFSTVLGDSLITKVRLDLSKLDDEIIYDEMVLGVTCCDDYHATSINIRAEANRESNIVDNIKIGENINICGETKEYYKLSIGFIQKKYVKLIPIEFKTYDK